MCYLSAQSDVASILVVGNHKMPFNHKSCTEDGQRAKAMSPEILGAHTSQWGLTSTSSTEGHAETASAREPLVPPSLVGCSMEICVESVVNHYVIHSLYVLYLWIWYYISNILWYSYGLVDGSMHFLGMGTVIALSQWTGAIPGQMLGLSAFCQCVDIQVTKAPSTAVSKIRGNVVKQHIPWYRR